MNTFDRRRGLAWKVDFLTHAAFATYEEADDCDWLPTALDLEPIEDLALERVAPGLERGLPLSDGLSKVIDLPKLSIQSIFDATEAEEPHTTATTMGMDMDLDVDLDEVTKVIENFTFVANDEKTRASTNPARIHYARQVDLQHMPEDWTEAVPQLAKTFPFELDIFQKQAIYHLERGESVFVAAHTSAGKTVVAEYAIALATKHMTKAIYTSPIKALSNQKFRDFSEQFESVGLLTGDIQLNPDASCLIMTTEILRSMLYRSAALIQDVEFVVFDEVHYVNDQERGVVWEEVIIMLPSHVTIIMLSATTPNNFEFANWVGRTRGGAPIYVISTLKRPIPLEHYLFTNRHVPVKDDSTSKTSHRKLLYKVVDASRVFNEQGYRAALQSTDSGTARDSSSAGGRLLSKATDNFRSINQEKNLWTDVTYFLEKRELLPVVVFTFSKRKCDENADNLGSMNLCTGSERSAIHLFLAGSLGRLKGTDAELPQIVWLKDLLSRGIGVHHSGLLPLLKEAVEILFSRGLVKILFATETFAMGVNMPARSVLFSSLRKHDGNSFRFLHPGEYTQMAGRAGRRGKDTVGTVIIVCPEAVPGEATLRQAILGQPTKLTSRFRLTYQMILSLLRIESLRVEEMLRRSFAENHSQQALPQQEHELVIHQEALRQIEAVSCSICAVDLEDVYEHSRQVRELGSKVYAELLRRHCPKFLPMGTIVVVDADEANPSLPALAIRSVTEDNDHALLCAIPDGLLEKGDAKVLPPSWPCAHSVNTASLVSKSSHFNFIVIPAKHIVRITAADRIQVSAVNLSPNGLQFVAKDTPGLLAEFAALLRTKTESLQVDAKLPQFSSLAGGFEFDEAALLRRQFLNQLQISGAFTCLRCPDFVRHYTMLHRKKLLTDRLAQLQFQLSEESLHLLPEYEARVRCLVALGYISPSHTVLVKGRVACEINTVDPLLLTELLFENAFGSAEPGEMAAILAGLVFQERSGLSLMASGLDGNGNGNGNGETIEGLLQRLLLHREDPIEPGPQAIIELEDSCDTKEDGAKSPSAKANVINATPNTEQVCRRIVDLCRSLSTAQREAGLAHLPCGSPLSYLLGCFNPALVRAVYEWTKGTSFFTLTTTVTSIAEGSIVRCLTRLDEALREVAGAGKIMGDPELVRKADEAIKLLRRDICFMSSLYL